MVTRLTDGLWHVDCRTLDRPNVYLVDDDEWTLIDAGWPRDVGTVRKGLREAGTSPAEIDRVLVTHYDADHVGSLGKLALDAPVHVHEADAPYVEGERLPPRTARRGLEMFHRLYYRRVEPPDGPVRRLRDGDEVGDFRVYHTPGHTPGHVVYVHEGVGAAFLGDLAWMRGGSLRPTDRITSYDRSRALESIRKLLERMPDVEHVCPGHGPPVSNGSRVLDQLRVASSRW